MKTLYVTLVAIAAALGIGLFVWKNPEFFSKNISPSIDRAKNMADRTWGAARSTAGRVADAAGDLLHTEKDPPNTPSQPA